MWGNPLLTQKETICGFESGKISLPSRKMAKLWAMDVQEVSENFDNFGFRIPLVLCTFPEFMDKNSAILGNKNKKLHLVTNVLYLLFT